MPPGRAWIWFAIALLLNFAVARFFLPSPGSPLLLPYTIFKEQVSKGNVAAIFSRGETLTGLLKTPVTYPPAEEKGAGRKQDTCDVAGGELRHAGRPGGLEVVDRSRAELDREPDRARFRELVAVQTQGQPGVAARFEVAARLVGVERATLEKDVGRVRDLARVGQHLGQQEVDVRIAVLELGRHRVRAEPRRDAACRTNRAQLGELGVVV